MGEDEEKELEVLETIEEEKARNTFLIGHLAVSLTARAIGIHSGTSSRIHWGREGLDTFCGRRSQYAAAGRDPRDVLRTIAYVCYTPFGTFRTEAYLIGEYWAQKAYGTSDSRGKQLRRDGFTLAGERYGEFLCLFRFRQIYNVLVKPSTSHCSKK